MATVFVTFLSLDQISAKTKFIFLHNLEGSIHGCLPPAMIQHGRMESQKKSAQHLAGSREKKEEWGTITHYLRSNPVT